MMTRTRRRVMMKIARVTVHTTMTTRDVLKEMMMIKGGEKTTRRMMIE